MKLLNIRYLFITLTAALFLSSCESRKNVFEGGLAVGTMQVVPVASQWDGESEIVLPPSKELTVDLVFSVDSMSEFRGDWTEMKLVKGIDDVFSVSYEQRTGYYRISNTLPVNTVLEDDELPVAELTFMASDVFGRKLEKTVVVKAANPAASDFNVEFKDNGDLDYSFSVSRLEESGAASQSSLVAYEYNVDGNLWHSGYGFEGDYDDACNPNPGHAALRGTYIISTPLSTVRHRFQARGQHVVAVRVKNDQGLWSNWKSFEVEVN